MKGGSKSNLYWTLNIKPLKPCDIITVSNRRRFKFARFLSAQEWRWTGIRLHVTVVSYRDGLTRSKWSSRWCIADRQNQSCAVVTEIILHVLSQQPHSNYTFASGPFRGFDLSKMIAENMGGMTSRWVSTNNHRSCTF